MKFTLKLILLVNTICCVSFGLPLSKMLPENYLRNELFKNYNPKVFPALHRNKQLNISMDVYLSSLDSVDIRSSTAKITALFYLKWNNHQLSWNGTKFDSVTRIRDTSSNVWVPTFAQRESSESFLSKHEREVTIFKDGSCEIPMLETISGTCTTAIKNFPNDVHKCSFVFYMVNVEHDSGQLLFQLNDGFSETINGAWSLQKSGKSEDFKGRLGFTINLIVKRKPNYITRKAIIPFVILAFLTVISHMLPVESGERVGFSMTAILTMIITIQYITDQLPETDDEPPVVFLGRLVLFFMVASLLSTTVVINLYHKKRKPMSLRIKRLLSTICRFLFISYNYQDQVSDIKAKSGCEEDENKDWITLALVFDRLFLLIFSIVTIILVIEVTKFSL